MRLALCVVIGAIMMGCVSVKNEDALVPPSGLMSDFSAPLIMPREPVPCAGLKSGSGSRSVFVKEWVWSGLSADVTDMTLRDAMVDGGIKKLYFADYSQFSFLGFVTVFSVTAYGE